MITTADRIQNVEEYYFSKKLREIAVLRSQGKDIINLGIGSPDLPPAQEVIKALQALASNTEVHGYQNYKGLPSLRAAFASWYKKYYQVIVDPESEILPLIGSKEGIMHISMTYLNPGDEVLVPNPGYPAYAATAALAGADCISYELNSNKHWQPDFDELNQMDLTKVKLMWVNYPNMPTGANATPELFKQLRNFAVRHNILICNDNPYSFILNNHPLSLLTEGLEDHILELNSLSKSHNMAGWRIGAVLGKKEHIDNILKFKSNMDSGMFLPMQKAAEAALTLGDNWYQSLNNTYHQRRKLAEEIMIALGCSFEKEQVGMFVWAKAPNHVSDVKKWIDTLIDKAEVFITPGFIFGSAGNRYLRISLCATVETLNKALNRIKNKKTINS